MFIDWKQEDDIRPRELPGFVWYGSCAVGEFDIANERLSVVGKHGIEFMDRLELQLLEHITVVSKCGEYLDVYHYA
jgi:hypothetical protein